MKKLLRLLSLAPIVYIPVQSDAQLKNPFTTPRFSQNRGGIVPGQILIKLTSRMLENRSKWGTSQYPNPLPGGVMRNRLGQSNWTLWTLEQAADTTKVARSLAGRTGIINAQPVNKIHTLLTLPNDPDYGIDEDDPSLYLLLDEENAGTFKRMWPLEDTNAFAAWSNYPNTWYTAINKPTRTPLIAVIDSGIDFGHPDFMNAGASSTNSINGGQINWALSKRFTLGGLDLVGDASDENGHGTHVAGTAIAAGNNGGFNNHGIIGMGYNSTGMILRVIDANGSGSDADAAAAIYYAADNGADIINLSLGTTSFSSALQDAVTYAFQKGCTVVAAGNEADAPPSPMPPIYPGASSASFCVTAAASQYQPATNYVRPAGYYDMAAPGGDLQQDIFTNYYIIFVWSTMPTYFVDLNAATYYPDIKQEYTQLIGTSMATPHVSGALGLYYGKWNLNQTDGWSNIEAMNALQLSANQVFTTSTGNWEANQGYGNLDAAALLNRTTSRAVTAGSFEGIVYLGTPASTAEVKAVKGTTTITTNSDVHGQYRFESLAPGTWTVTAKSTIYTAVRKVIVKAGCERPGVDFWCGGFSEDTTPPVAARVQLATAPTGSSFQVKHWAFDPETEVTACSYRIGTTAGANNIKADTEVVIDTNTFQVSGVSLVNGTTYFMRVTYTNGAGLTTSRDLVFVANTVLRTVSGNVQLQDWLRNQAHQVGTIELRTQGTNTVLESFPLVLNRYGDYNFTTTRSGTFDVSIRAGHWISQKKTVNINSASVVNQNFSLKNGDAVADNTIDLTDYLALAEAFDSMLGDNNFVSEADLNGDYAVDLTDYLILVSNFDQVGE